MLGDTRIITRKVEGIPENISDGELHKYFCSLLCQWQCFHSIVDWVWPISTEIRSPSSWALPFNTATFFILIFPPISSLHWTTIICRFPWGLTFVFCLSRASNRLLFEIIIYFRELFRKHINTRWAVSEKWRRWKGKFQYLNGKKVNFFQFSQFTSRLSSTYDDQRRGKRSLTVRCRSEQSKWNHKLHKKTTINEMSSRRFHVLWAFLLV